MDKNELFQIGEVAKLFHISVGSLRHYEKIGLLSPEYIDTDTGYRYYSVRQFECLNTIRYLRVLDTPLEQIAGFLKNRDVDRIQKLLEQQKSAVIEKQRELAVIEKKIDNRLHQLKDALSSELDTVSVAELPQRRVVWLRNKLTVESYLDLELYIRKLEEHQQNALVFLGKVGVGISEVNLLLGKYSEYDRIFLILDNEDDYEGVADELPQQVYVTLRFRGTHKEAATRYEKLNGYISEHHMEIAGGSTEITMIDYGYTNDPDKFVTEIQIPVIRNKK